MQKEGLSETAATITVPQIMPPCRVYVVPGGRGVFKQSKTETKKTIVAEVIVQFGQLPYSLPTSNWCDERVMTSLI